MLNIVIPMAGLGSRFIKAGYTVPKPLLPINGIPMIELVVKNLTPSEKHTFHFIALSDLLEKYDLERILRKTSNNYTISLLDEPTRGAAETVLAASDLIDNDSPLMIANCDQYLNMNIDSYLQEGNRTGADAFLLTMTSVDPKWSFVEFDAEKKVKAIWEKIPVTDRATVGIYNYARGADFVSASREMIDAGEMSNGEFYVAPVYTRLVQSGLKVRDIHIDELGGKFFGLGTPKDYEKFIKENLFSVAR